MANDSLDLSEPELTLEDILRLDDPRYTQDSVAVVTGAASGIGQATAVALGVNGLSVIGADRNGDDLHETVDLADDLEASGTIHPVQTDLTEDEDVTSMIEVAADLGDLRFIANIAGVQHIASIPEFPMDRYDILLNVMLRAPFLTAKLAIPHIRDTDDGIGAIGNMSSVHGHYATQDKSAYITAKH